MSRTVSVRDVTRGVTPTHAYPELMGELGCPGDCGVLNVPFNANVDYKTGVFNASLKLNAPASEAYSKKLKAKPASWACPTCTLENYGGEQCEVCGAGRPSESEKNAAAWFTDQVEEDDTANAYMAPAKLPELVHLSVKHCDVMQMRGPTAHSNWVIPGRLLQGPHPGMNDDLESELVCLVGSGVTRFVSLATSNEMMSIGMYNKAAQVVASHINTKTCSGRNATLTRLQFNQVQAWEADQPAPEQELKILVKTLIGVLEGRDVLYVHCTNGHGRSGFMCALLLAQLYALNSYDALDRINRYHSSRGGTNDISGYFSSRLSPEMEAQLHQVVADNQESQEGLKEPLMQPGANRQGDEMADQIAQAKQQLSVALTSMGPDQMNALLNAPASKKYKPCILKRRDSLDNELGLGDSPGIQEETFDDVSGPMSMSEDFFKKFMDSGR